MSTQPAAPASGPFFLAAEPGQRFCLLHAPLGGCRGAVVYIHPFAEEMNKSRRVAAEQARALAATGFAVLQIDLLGCGDSSGDFADARWDAWKADVVAAIDWLAARYPAPLTLLGLRLGGLLALDVAHTGTRQLARVVLWNPVQSGATYLKQFLRLLTVNEMLADERSSGQSAPAPSSNARDALLAGTSLEVAGYELAPALALAIEVCDAARLPVTSCPVDWIETVSSLERPEAPAITRLADKWRTAGVAVQLHRVVGPAFWATQEIEQAPALVAATTTLLAEAAQLPRAAA
ncbi:MAG: hydrolase 2, exosortase A system-associated [Massilia sp.]